MKLLATLFLLFAMFVPAKPHCNEQQLRQLTLQAESVVIAEIVEVKQGPGFWSGHIAAVQYVRYKVVETLKGRLNSPDLSVGHYLVKNSLTADRREPRLSPELFKQGNKLILFLCFDQEKHYFICNENCGAVLADNQKLTTIRQIISSDKPQHRKNSGKVIG